MIDKVSTTDAKDDNSDAGAAGQVPMLFRPFSLRGVTFGNRIVVTPMCQYSADDGYAANWHFAHHGRFSLAGVGAAVIEATGVTRDGRITPGCLGIYEDGHIEGLSRITAIYHEQRIPVGIQLAHAGRKASAAVPLQGAAPLVDCDPSNAWQAVAPSAIALADSWPVPRALAESDIEAIIEAFGKAAERAVESGFDFVEIHGAHGYLIHSFLAPLSNRRQDHWGGDSLENRMRFALRIAERIRGILPEDMPLFYRASVVDGVDGGVTIDETIALAGELRKRGVDIMDCSSGGISGPSGRALVPPSPGYLVPYAKQVKEAASIPTMAVGLIIEPQQAEAIIAEGSADLVAIGRQLLDDPNFPFHAAQALGHPDPFSILPASYGFFLSRRKLS